MKTFNRRDPDECMDDVEIPITPALRMMVMRGRWLNPTRDGAWYVVRMRSSMFEEERVLAGPFHTVEQARASRLSLLAGDER